MVRWFGAVQAQDLPMARWSVGQRLTTGGDREVDAALADGTVLRTHVLRPTWHLVARTDLRWMLALTAPRVLARLKPYDRRAGVDPDVIGKSIRAMVSAIEKNGHLTRDEAAAVLARRGIRVESGWLVGHLLMHAELRGVICSGRPRGAAQTHALVEERAVPKGGLRGDEALAELGTRYFQSHSPATALDFRWWSGLSAAEVRRALGVIAPDLETISVADTVYLVHRNAAALAVPRTRPNAAHLLQAFDELVVGYSETRHVVDLHARVRERKPDGLLTRTVVLDGQVVGRWRRELKTDSMDVAVELVDRVSRTGRLAIERAVRHFAQFHDRPAVLRMAE